MDDQKKEAFVRPRQSDGDCLIECSSVLLLTRTLPFTLSKNQNSMGNNVKYTMQKSFIDSDLPLKAHFC